MRYHEDIQRTISTIDSEYRRLSSRFRTFGEDDWNRPSFCPGWDVSEVVGHITFGADFFASIIENGLAGRLILPFGAGNEEEFMKIRTAKTRELAVLQKAKLVDRFEENMKTVLAIFRSLSPEDYDKPAMHRRGVFPIRRFILTRLNELLLHEWDIRNEPEAPLAGEPVKVATGNLRQHFPLFYNLSPNPRLEGTFRFEAADTGQAWEMAVENGKAEDSGGSGGNAPDVSFSATAGDFMLLMSGRADARKKEASGNFRIEGDRSKAEALLPKIFVKL